MIPSDAGATVFVTRRVPDEGLEPLRRANCRLRVRDADHAIARDELLERAAGVDALVTFLSDRVDDELLDAAGPALRVVANFAVGYDNVDVAACSARGVAVANTPEVLTDATADFAWALLLAAARRLPEAQALAASGSWSGWQPLQLLGRDVAGRTLGVVGMGRIGRAVARRGRGFDMRVLYHNRSPDRDAERELGAEYRELDALLRESDFVSLHAPLTDATRHLIGARELAAMKPTAVLVNTARGPLVDEAALVDALQRGPAGDGIFAAGLDVFEAEPRLHPQLAELPNAVLAPHLGSATEGARLGMARLCAEAVAAVLGGRRVDNLLNPEVVGG